MFGAIHNKYSKAINMSIDLDTELNGICRCCLAPGDLKSLFCANKTKTYAYYHEMIKYCCDLLVTENDGLPAHICTNCLTKLKSSYKFKQKCIESNTKLLHWTTQTLKHERNDLHLEKLNKTFYEQSQFKDANYQNQAFEDNESYSEYQMKDIKTEIKSENTSCENNKIFETEISVELEVKDSNELSDENIDFSKPHITTEKQFKTEAESQDSLKPLKEKKKSTKLECGTCGQQFYKSANLQEHINWKHYGIKKYHCSICNKDYMKEKQHRDLHEKSFSATCDQCGKIYSSERQYKYHLESHGNKEHICECGATFQSESSLKRHISGVHAPRKYMCHFCSKAFTMRTYLILHLRLHTGEKPYKCHLCGKCFRVKLMLKRHMMGKHSDVRSFQCSQCPKEFKTRNVLSKHMAVHAEVRQFACRVCQKPFGRVDNRNVHERSVHSISREEAKLMWPS